MPTTIETENVRASLWAVWTYDVWGNATDGWEVNDRYCIASTHPLDEHETIYNPGSSHEFSGWFPSEDDIVIALDIVNDMDYEYDIEGDDDIIYVTLSEDGYPLGELHRVNSFGEKV